MMFPFVKVFENVLAKNLCDELIEEFDKTENEFIIRDNDVIKFTEINFNKSEKWNEVVQYMLQLCNYYQHEYMKEFQIDDIQFPHEYAFEEFRMKRYLPNNHDEFKLHVDVTDHASAKRYLSYLFYLNDVEEGGETTFGRNNEIVIKPVAGNLMMFPPMWNYIHAGKKPLSGKKYILTTYNHYI